MFSRDDVILEHGVLNSKLFLVIRGDCEVLNKEEALIRVICAGGFFGEDTFLLSENTVK